MFTCKMRCAALLLALGITLVTVPKARSLGSPDFKVFYTAARHMVEDPENLYRVSPDRYLYPPTTALLLLPFAATKNYPLHQWLWHGFLGLLVFLLVRRSWATWLALALLTRYLLITFSYGQINLPIIALLAAAGAAQGRAWTGALWSLAAGIKIYPLVLAPALLRERKWGTLFTAVLVGVSFLALPFLCFGTRLGGSLYQDFFAALEAKGLPIYSHNQSLAALALRLFTPATFSLHSVGPTSWGILHLPTAFARNAALFLGLVLTFFTWRKVWQVERPRWGMYLAAMAFSILFLSHIVWKDYFLLLYFPLVVLLQQGKRATNWWMGSSYLALITVSSPDILGAAFASRLDAACIHLLGAVLLWICWLRLPRMAESESLGK